MAPPSNRTGDGVDRGLEPLTSEEAMQAAVLASILAEHPAQLTPTDLYRERKDPDDLAERDAVDRAIETLVAAGLLHRSGPLLVPSRAALKFDDLHSL
jgi:hypothetical protein